MLTQSLWSNSYHNFGIDPQLKMGTHTSLVDALEHAMQTFAPEIASCNNLFKLGVGFV